MAAVISIGGRAIGAGAPCFVIAEAGVNHNGSVELAEKLIDVAAEAGAYAVKFQTFDPELLAAPEAAKAEYQVETTGKGGSQLEMLRALALPAEAHRRLQERARSRGILFLSTPFEERSADLLASLELPAFKISSGDLTNLPFLAHVAKKGRPMLISTGMATLAEVEAALGAVAGVPVALFHCVSNYPTVPEDCNLRAMETMRRAFGVPVGWSDHTLGIDVAVAAAALGAELVEKHFTLDRTMEGPDHRASLEPGELAEMVSSIRRVRTALGDGEKRPRPGELPVAQVARRSLHWRRALAAGARVGAEDLIALRPAHGLAPADLPRLVGRTLARAVAANTLVRGEDFEP
jgi:N-acetylneuraminate synthase/N,N'-diacetyllegionaminate synthase